MASFRDNGRIWTFVKSFVAVALFLHFCSVYFGGQYARGESIRHHQNQDDDRDDLLLILSFYNCRHVTTLILILFFQSHEIKRQDFDCQRPEYCSLKD